MSCETVDGGTRLKGGGRETEGVDSAKRRVEADACVK